MLKIALSGASGRVNQLITQAIIQEFNDIYTISHAITTKEITEQLAKFSPQIINDVDKLDLTNCDGVIDFSNPELTLQILEKCIKYKKPIVIGTTGFNPEQIKSIKNVSNKIPVLFSPNMSLSVNLLFKLVKEVAQQLPQFEAEIIEMHHRNKKDAPSGTALQLGKLIADSRNLDFNKYALYDRSKDDLPRTNSEIGFSVVRGGDIVGTHEVLFLGDGENLTLKSEITNRMSFAYGALSAFRYIVTQKPGLYSMEEVLAL